jgi:hypothetical protein
MIALSRIKDLMGGPEASTGPRISIFGDSHSVALLRAQQYLAAKRAYDYGNVRVNRLRKDKNGKAVGDTSLADFCREVREFGPNDFVFSAVGGNQYAIVSTVRPLIEYDILSSPTDEILGEMVPFRAMASFIDSGIRETVGPVLREIRKATEATLVHLVPPPPKQDNAFIAAHAEGYFASEGLQDLGPSRPELRLKCWKMQLGSLAALCDELGIDLLMPPEKTVTADGFLEPSCYAKDVTHANRRYGEAVFRQILEVTGTGKGKSR